jgi:hypothetical protein
MSNSIFRCAEFPRYRFMVFKEISLCRHLFTQFTYADEARVALDVAV